MGITLKLQLRVKHTVLNFQFLFKNSTYNFIEFEFLEHNLVEDFELKMSKNKIFFEFWLFPTFC